MVIIPFSPFACAMVMTTILVITFFVGRFYGIRWCAEELMKTMEIWENDPKE